MIPDQEDVEIQRQRSLCETFALLRPSTPSGI